MLSGYSVWALGNAVGHKGFVRGRMETSMTHAPRIPEEQRSEADHGGKAGGPGACGDRRDLETGILTGQPGDVDVNLDEQGRFGNLRQNLTNHWKVQDR